jgi:transposase InsO family protein
MNHELRDAIALFRWSLIGELVQKDLTTQQRTALLADKASRRYEIPGSQRTRVAASTLRDWMRLYQQQGLEGLRPPVRADHGDSRAIAPAVADRIIALREEDPSRSVHTILRMLQLADALGGEPVPAPATVYRLLSGRGLSRRSRKAVVGRDRRAFAFERPNQMWQSDVMHGPRVRARAGGPLHKSYLITVLDDATRVVVATAWCFGERQVDFVTVLRAALLRRGVPDRLFVDNGAAYVSKHLGLVCAQLGIALIHARPFQPEAKGKIERWHRTVRSQWLNQLDLEPLCNQGGLEPLNQRLWAWVEGEYHRRPHRGLADGPDGLAMTPLDAWMVHAANLRPAPANLDELLLDRQQRLVRRDRTVHLDGERFEVPAEYVDRKVELRYELGRADQRRVYLYDKGVQVQQLRRLDLRANSAAQRAKDPPVRPPAPTGMSFGDLLRQRHGALIAGAEIGSLPGADGELGLAVAHDLDDPNHDRGRDDGQGGAK